MDAVKVEEYLEIGLGREEIFRVTEEHTAKHMGSGAVQVLATPWMILYIEKTALNLLAEHLPKGYSSVGTLVNVRHLAPSAVESEVRACVKIMALDGFSVVLDVEVWDREVLVGKGTHERYVIDIERFLERVQDT
jgi:predicted thioesterase